MSKQAIRYNIRQMKKLFEKENCILLETTYKNAHTLMQYVCECGNLSYIRWNNFRSGQRCWECRREKLKQANIGSLNPAWAGGITHCKDGYRKIKSRNHPFKDSKGYVYEHRLVMEKKLGRYLTKEEVVHHIDGNRLNNDINNLELFSSNSDHLNKCHVHRGDNHE